MWYRHHPQRGKDGVDVVEVEPKGGRAGIDVVDVEPKGGKDGVGVGFCEGIKQAG